MNAFEAETIVALTARVAELEEAVAHERAGVDAWRAEAGMAYRWALEFAREMDRVMVERTEARKRASRLERALVRIREEREGDGPQRAPEWALRIIDRALRNLL